jgi:hypothetical protein
MLPSRRISRFAVLPLLLLLITVSGFGARSLLQQKTSKAMGEIVKLEYSGEGEPTKVTDDLRPLALSANRLLVPVGDTLYMLGADRKVVWEYSLEPNVILDFISTPEGSIYVAASDGLLIALNASGKRVWGNSGVCGSANYTQLANYAGGFLAVFSMEAYRSGKGSDAEDILEFWKGGKIVWHREFPRNAKLLVWGDKILSVNRTKKGKEIQEVK